MVDAAVEALRKAKADVIDALQMEFFMDDVAPPPEALGWDAEALKAFYQSGGVTKPAAPAPVAAATEAADDSGPDPALMQFLQETEALSHLAEKMAEISWDECEELYKEGRPKLLGRLSKAGVSLSDRQKFVTVFGKATKPAGLVKSDQPGGARKQPPPYVAPLIDVPGRQMAVLEHDLIGYQNQVIRDGIPFRKAGLFPPNEEFLTMLSQDRKPCTKGLPAKTMDGGREFGVAENGWASGDNACEHGMDLRWFIKPGLDDKTLMAAVRFSDFACIGAGYMKGVHGGAVETCLDEATAECAKTKLFPVATTSKISFAIKRPLEAHTTYRVYCEVGAERIKGVSYEVKGEITDVQNDKLVYASCLATLASPAALEKLNEGGTVGPEAVS